MCDAKAKCSAEDRTGSRRGSLTQTHTHFVKYMVHSRQWSDRRLFTPIVWERKSTQLDACTGARLWSWHVVVIMWSWLRVGAEGGCVGGGATADRR